MNAVPKNTRIEAFLAHIRDRDAARFAIVAELRRIILASDLSVSEEIKYGGLLFSAHKPFCGIFVYTNHITLDFGDGAALPDPHGVLQGEGKMRRHIKLTAFPDIGGKQVAKYIALALESR